MPPWLSGAPPDALSSSPPPQGHKQDLLFICTEQCQICVLAYDAEKGELVTRAGGRMEDPNRQQAAMGIRGAVDPQCRAIALHFYDGLLKLIPIDGRGHLKEAFDVRVEELNLHDFTFLVGCARPTLAVLYKNNREQLHVKTYTLNLAEKDLEPAPQGERCVGEDLDEASALLAPVPLPIGGCLVVRPRLVCHLNPNMAMTHMPTENCEVEAIVRVDDDGSRFLLSDVSGQLFVLGLELTDKKVFDLTLAPLGSASPAQTMSYLDGDGEGAGVVYIGSGSGDNQLVRFSSDPVAGGAGAAGGSHVEVLETFTNLGPIVDMCVVDLERQGLSQIVTCSGVYGSGSLRVIRNGIGVIEEALAELPGIRGVWALRSSTADEHDKYLVVSFVSDTMVLAIDGEDELGEAELFGLDRENRTLHCGNVGRDFLLQVTPHGVRLLQHGSEMVADEWAPEGGTSISLASCNASQLVLAHGGNKLTLFEVGSGSLELVKEVDFPSEISCLDATPLPSLVASDGTASTGPGARASMLAVGTWTTEVCLLSLPDLKTVHSEPLGGDFIARSVLFSEFESQPYLMCGMGNGDLVSFRLQREIGGLGERRRVSLGTQPLQLRPFRAKDSSHVFAGSDRPAVVHASSNSKLLYSSVNLKDASIVSRFSTPAFPDCLAIATGEGLVIGAIEDIQRLHIRTIPLGAQPRRICHLPEAGCFGVCTIRSTAEAGSQGGEATSVVLMDERTFATRAAFDLEPNEYAASICAFSAPTGGGGEGRECLVVGTYITDRNEDEPKRGRILVLAPREGPGGGGGAEVRIEVVASQEMKGCVYQVCPLGEDKLLAGINNKVQVFSLAESSAEDDGGSPGGASRFRLACGAKHRGHVVALFLKVRGDLILVGDLMKSVSLLRYNGETGQIEDVAADRATNWMTAVDFLDEDTYLGVEHQYNIFTLGRNQEALIDDDRQVLNVVGRMHLGEQVNVIKPGSLVMRMSDGELGDCPTRLFGTVNGSIGVLASLPHALFLTLERLQAQLSKVLKGVGGLDHQKWRAFRNDSMLGSVPMHGFIDGDLVESFLDLPRGVMDQVAEEMGMDAEDISKMIEDIRLY